MKTNLILSRRLGQFIRSAHKNELLRVAIPGSTRNFLVWLTVGELHENICSLNELTNPPRSLLFAAVRL